MRQMHSMIDSTDDNGSTDWTQPGIAAVSGLESLRVVQVAQLLPKHERDALFDAVCISQKAFHRPGIPGGEDGGSLYFSPDSDERDQSGVCPASGACLCLSKRIRELLPELFTALGIESFPVPSIPLTVVNGRNGHVGLPHTDESAGRFVVSLLYYFHRAPKAFRGGDLEFYNTDPTSVSGQSIEPLARIDHTDNLLIAFPSDTFHGITEVRCDSDDFADGRFAAIGFLGPNG